MSDEERAIRRARFLKTSKGKTIACGPGVLKVDALLREEHRTDYYAMIRNPAVTLAECAAWLKAHGYDISSCSIGNHRRRFRERIEQTRLAAEMAHMFVEVGRERGAVDVSEACVAYVEQQMMQTFFALIRAQRNKEEFDAGLWERVQRIVGQQAKNRVTIEKARILAPAQAEKQKKKKLAEMTLEERKEACREAALLGRKVLGIDPV